ncbi:MAG TPA: hypothetical protein VHZ97_28515 [Pseudonocardiaceae bacterium]|jgi:hypothetical protein|nr:hypothetical protein [Pseudonocardiaceae bacterium]
MKIRNLLRVGGITLATVVVGLSLVGEPAWAGANGRPAPEPPGFAQAPWSFTHDQLQAMLPKARPADVASPQAIVAALQEAVNGPQGAWSSNRLRSLCAPDVVFAEVDKNDDGQEAISDTPMDAFITEVKQVHDAGPWYEYVTKINSVSTVYRDGGGLSVVDYEAVGSTKAGDKSGTPTEVQSSLMFDGKRWWVLNHTW